MTFRVIRVNMNSDLHQTIGVSSVFNIGEGVLKKFLLAVITIVIVVVPLAFAFTQEQPDASSRIEITGVNPSQLPTVVITTNVFDSIGQPVPGLTIDNFTLSGDLAQFARIVSVENITDDNLAFSTVLVIDTSSSMDGQPILEAQEAARRFVNAIGPNDAVAIISFNNDPFLVQDFTTDKQVLLSAIDRLRYGGKTSLYDAGVEGVRRATESTLPRRAVVLLSDGAEFGGVSVSGRGAALNEARLRGVPVYTIGLGYGIDRTYLQELSSGTNARFYESPTPDQLTQIYEELAALFRSQYIITLAADVPPDGTVYGLTVQAALPTAENVSAETTVRAPITTPIVTIENLPAGQISEPTTVQLTLKADDPLFAAEALVDDVIVKNDFDLQNTNFDYTIDPVTLAPGAHTLTFNVTDFNAADAGGDTGTVTVPFEVAALPSTLALNLPVDADGRVSEATTVTLEASGQTPVVSTTYSIDGVAAAAASDDPFSFLLDPFLLNPGDHLLTVDAVNAGGVLSTTEQPFTVATLPPKLTVNGLSEGQVIESAVEITVEAVGQTPIRAIDFASDDGTISSVADSSSATFILDPYAFAPGPKTLTIVAIDSSQETDIQAFGVEIAAVPPQLTLGGVENGQVIAAPTDVTVDAASQGSVRSILMTVGDVEIGSVSDSSSGTFTIDPFNFAPGTQALNVTVTDINGVSTSQSLDVEISAVPPVLTIQGVEEGQVIDAPVDIVVDSLGQSAIGSISLAVGDVLLGSVENANSGTFTVDPFNFAPGTQPLTVSVVDANGQTTTQQVNIEIASVPPVVIVTGIETNQVVSTPTAVSVEARGQTAINSVEVSLGDVPVDVTTADGISSFTIDPAAYAPGIQALIVTVTDSAGAATTQNFGVDILALPAEISISGLAGGDVLNSVTDVALSFTSQTPITQVTVDFDSSGSSTSVEAPFSGFSIDPAALGEGDHTVQISALNAGGVETTVEVPFSVVLPTGTPTEEPTPLPTDTPTDEPTAVPTDTPTDEPTAIPTDTPTDEPTAVPTDTPTDEPTAVPTDTPTDEPTAVVAAVEPTATPTDEPTDEPTSESAATDAPTDEPAPTDTPTEEPTSVAQAATATEEETAEAAASPQPSLTPVEIVEIPAEAQTTPENNQAPLLLAFCGILLLAALILFLMFRRRR